MSSPEGSPASSRGESLDWIARDLELRRAVRREDLWIRLNTSLLAILFAILAFFGRDLYNDVKGHSTQLAALSSQVAVVNERVGGLSDRFNSLQAKVDKLALDTEDNGRTLAEIKGFLQATPHASSKESAGDSSRR